MRQNFILGASTEGYHRVAYTEWGKLNSDSSAVICVHGLTRNGRDFDALANYLSTQGQHVFCPDIVGRGASEWLKDPHLYTFERYIADMNLLIARTCASKIDWIGTSMGGIIGIMMASMPNTPIRSLILNDVGPQVPINGLWRIAKYSAQNPEFLSFEKAKEYYKELYAEFGISTEEQWDFFTKHSIRERSPGVFVANYDPRLHEAKFKLHSMKELFHSPHKALEGVLFDIDLWSYWEGIKCPVLVIRGQNSELLLPQHIKRMQRSHSKVDVYEIANTGHAPALLESEHHEKIASWLNLQSINYD